MSEGQRGGHKARRQAIRRKVQRRHDRFYERCSHWSLPGENTGAGRPIHWHREHWVLAATVALMTLLSAVAMPSWANAMKRITPVPHTIVRLSLPALPPPSQTPSQLPWRMVEVQPGQTLSDIFKAQGLGFSDVQRALDASTDSTALRNIRPGDLFAFRIGHLGKLVALRFDADPTRVITLHFDGAIVTRTVLTRTYELRQHIAHGVIEHSLSAAAAKAGLSNAVMVQLTHIFHDKIDFRRNIRAGDRFTVIYNAVYLNGSYQHAGNVLAAEFMNRGHRYTAYRYELPDGHVGYYSIDGRPLSVSLLRTPVKYTRISSPFGWRFDPVMHREQLHAGVDLAAPMGTPIHAASRGVITVHRWVHGYGRYICIKLNSVYSTCYAHMSRYAPKLHDGSHVTQGEIIGYVGMTGFATGPHLHFEVRVHGKPVNPLTVTMPKPKPLAPSLLAGFKQHTRTYLARIQLLHHRIKLAKAMEHADAATVVHAG
ncbi:MAG TPA: peptidoglycan DD-metalloendopeptidase family protein [Rhodanobacteraceae bacterium]